MNLVEQSLRERIGLDASSIGSSVIQRIVRLRMKSLGVHQVQEYQKLLEHSPAEWNELVESVIVTETWFFRDREAFATFARLALEEWLPQHPTRPLRILSVPCSSGEEPYSLVMALVSAGIPPERFLIDAVDISARALARARRGVYGRNSFRGRDVRFRDQYFQAAKEGFVLSPAIRKCVHFHLGNVLGDGFLPGRGSYDFIFCRNLLIYFDRPTQARALARIAELLAPAGVLFVGAAEQPLALEHGFVSAQIPMAFACRKAGQAGARAEHRRPAKAVLPQFPLPSHAAPFPKREGNGASGAELLAEPAARKQTDLDEARRLADAGRLQEAAAICEAHLRERRTSASAYYLLGLIRDAQGDASAVEYYRKALYLEPGHHESLLQMALWAEKSGDATQAGRFKRRAQRHKGKL